MKILDEIIAAGESRADLTGPNDPRWRQFKKLALDNGVPLARALRVALRELHEGSKQHECESCRETIDDIERIMGSGE